MSQPMLKVENLTVYSGYINALKDVTIEVNEGEIITLIGSNGAGKTTTLMSISNLVEKAGGKISFRSEDITRKAPDKIVKLGISHVPEGRKIFPQLTVYENLVAGTFGQVKVSKQRIKELVEENYTLFPRLKERTKQSGGSLSGGEQQMLAIARGLMMDPKLIMLDEPSLGVAPKLVDEIYERIEKLKDKGMTVFLVEQNTGYALELANRGYVLENGRITMEGPSAELANSDHIRKAYLGL